MSSIETQVIKYLSSKENYYKYKDFAKTGVLLNETRTIIEDFNDWFKKYPDKNEIEWDNYRLWYRLERYPGWKTEKKELYDKIITEAEKQTVDDLVKEKLIEQYFANNIAGICRRVGDNDKKISLNDIRKLLDDYNKATATKGEDVYNVPVDANLVTSSLNTSGGLDWRLFELNSGVGPLYKSDHVMIGKRPESGGTSFMISEMTFMLPQLPEGKKAIIFHNEEGAYKIAARILQTALNINTGDIIADPVAVNTKFDTYSNGRAIEIYHNPDMSIYDVERKLQGGEYYLIGFNILEKVRGFKDSEQEHARYARLSAWARNLAVQYGVVFSIAQADFSAEGSKYMNQSQLMNSKTGVQQETDVLIMIGRDADPAYEDTRFISIVRNKKPSVSGMNPKLKYAKFETYFNHETGIYRSK